MSKYVKLTDIDHVLLRPEINIGSTEPYRHFEYMASGDLETIYGDDVDESDALVRIFVEVMANAVDNIYRNTSTIKCTAIKVDMDGEGYISVWNNGSIIPIRTTDNYEGLYNHTLVFGCLRSSSNYNDDVLRETSGKNGVGVKCTNIFSKHFMVEGMDPTEGKVLVQEWTNNMKETNGPQVKIKKTGNGYTMVKYLADFERFNVDGYSTTTKAIIRKLVIDCAMVAANHKVKVYWCGSIVNVKNFQCYASLYGSIGEVVSFQTDKHSVVVTPKANRERSISFVNGLFTRDGGQHVDAWTKDILSALALKLSVKGKEIKVKDLVTHYRFFVNSTIDKPQFESQSKHKLIKPSIKVTITDTIISKIFKWNHTQNLKQKILSGKDALALKSIGKDKVKRKVPKIKEYDPANRSGTVDSHKCILIVCEGLSAKTFAVAGINKGINYGSLELKGRDWFGILPLRGKFLNVRNAAMDKVSKNAVVNDLVTVLSLKIGKRYGSIEDIKTLNYGGVMVLPDPDTDGIHIEALVLNFFHYFFPSLIEPYQGQVFPFIQSMKVPIIKVLPNLSFYSQEAFDAYTSTTKPKHSQIEYFKGLGTTKASDVPLTFGKKMVEFVKDDGCDVVMCKAFDDELSDERKEWLKQYDPSQRSFSLDTPGQWVKLNITTFINEELIKFSMDDCRRSIPSGIDGLKESQRKVIYALKLRTDPNKIKVAQLGAFVAQKTDYKHGEQNLADTIVKMAQSYIGSNNVPLLQEDGMFGTRLDGGKDAANPRYIFTKPSSTFKFIFRPEDDSILTPSENGEPICYAPIVPLILINGGLGIGTGFSTTIPMYSPIHIIDQIMQWIDNGSSPTNHTFSLTPWYRGYTGSITRSTEHKWASYGSLKLIKKFRTTYEYVVDELPINVWTNKYKEHLESFVDDGTITDFHNHSTTDRVEFRLFSKKELTIDDLKLKSLIHTSNMVVFNHKQQLYKYNTVNGIMQRFCIERYNMYGVRRVHILDKLRHELKVLENKRKFMVEVMDGSMKVFMVPEEDVIKQLQSKGYFMDGSYDYLLRIHIRSFTKENVEKLNTSITKVKEQINHYLTTTNGNLWKAELEELKQHLVHNGY